MSEHQNDQRNNQSNEGGHLTNDPATNDPMFRHHYDGIHELDNPLPGWWLATFYLAIISCGLWVVYIIS